MNYHSCHRCFLGQDWSARNVGAKLVAQMAFALGKLHEWACPYCHHSEFLLFYFPSGTPKKEQRN